MMTINNISIVDEEKCCGCSSCKLICPSKAISMKENEKGFLYPIVDNTKCTNCYLCLKVCEGKEKNTRGAISLYAVKHKDRNVLSRSSSGGASRAFCEAMINNGGVVYGVSYSKDFSVVVTRATTLTECDGFFGSKYVATNPELSYLDVYQDLLNGKSVLYISTSCYISALQSFLRIKKIDTTKLITVDFICHGTPSPKLYREYISFINRKNNLTEINFRSKKKGWKHGSYCCVLSYKNGKEEVDTVKSRIFINLFGSDNCLRESCYSCPYVKDGRAGDFTIADFWGINKIKPHFDSSLGVSAVYVNSKKAEEFWRKIDSIYYEACDIDEAKQFNLHSPTKKGQRYNRFWDEYEKNGFIAIAKLYGGMNLYGRIRTSFLFNTLKKIKNHTDGAKYAKHN